MKAVSAIVLPAESQRAVLGLNPWPTGPILVVTATCFNVLLCFINTKHWVTVGAPHIVAISIALLAAGVVTVRQQIDAALLGPAVLVVLVVAGLKLINPQLDLKILFDLAIAPVFYLLGRQSTVQAAERMLAVLMVIIIAIGLVELYLVDLFQQQLDILGFYTSKGTVSANAINYSGTTFFGSAERGGDAGRTLLPFLFSNHRISSIFLEPISLGNFSLACLAWLLCVRQRWTATHAFLAFGTGLCIVLPDSRQAAATSIIMVLARWVPWPRSRQFAVALPLTVLGALVVLGMITHGPFEDIGITSDDFRGRLVFSAELLASFDWAEWFAVAPSEIYTADTGYAYLVNGIGLPLILLLATRFASAGRDEGPATAMRGVFAIYIATSLCIGASFFSIKTAALFWFLFGVTQAIRPNRPHA